MLGNLVTQTADSRDAELDVLAQPTADDRGRLGAGG